jgi:hypothetical protein
MDFVTLGIHKVWADRDLLQDFFDSVFREWFRDAW